LRFSVRDAADVPEFVRRGGSGYTAAGSPFAVYEGVEALAQSTSPFPPRPEKKSPFPRKSLPQAGESLEEAVRDLFVDNVFAYGAVGIAFAVVAVAEWVLRWLGRPVTPAMWALAAVACGGIAAWRFFKLKPQFAALRQAIRGEREIARMLEALRALGYVPFHDLPGDGFNVDHALIGPGGVFAIETKTISKRPSKDAVIDYDGTRVLVDGETPDRDPVAQAEAVADHVRDVLRQMTGRMVDVRPVVLYPGWFVTPQPRGCRTWVLNPKALATFLKNEPRRLSPEDVALYADRLTLHLSQD
jgi:hypothetical protein